MKPSAYTTFTKENDDFGTCDVKTYRTHWPERSVVQVGDTRQIPEAVDGGKVLDYSNYRGWRRS